MIVRGGKKYEQMFWKESFTETESEGFKINFNNVNINLSILMDTYDCSLNIFKAILCWAGTVKQIYFSQNNLDLIWVEFHEI
jgi:hypothetical protein